LFYEAYIIINTSRQYKTKSLQTDWDQDLSF